MDRLTISKVTGVDDGTVTGWDVLHYLNHEEVGRYHVTSWKGVLTHLQNSSLLVEPSEGFKRVGG